MNISLSKHQSLDADASTFIPTERQLRSRPVQRKVDLWLDTIEQSRTPLATLLGKRKRSPSKSSTSSGVLGDKFIANGFRSPVLGGKVIPGSTMNTNWVPATPTSSCSKDPSTPTSQSSKQTSAWSGRPEWVQARLADHGILETDRNVLRDRYPDMYRIIQDILGANRNSEMKPSSMRKFGTRLRSVKGLNEDTILAHLIPRLIKDSRTQKLDPESIAYHMAQDEEGTTAEASTDKQKEVLVARDWLDDGVTFVVNREFRRSLLPTSYIKDDPELNKAFSKRDGLSNPKPDYCWGFLPPLLDVDKPRYIHLDPDIRLLLELVPSLENTFFIIEGKSNVGNALQAQVQAQRGGAALVHAARRLVQSYTLEGAEVASGADTQSFVFSATMTPDLMKLYVHWAETFNPPTTGQGQSHATLPTPGLGPGRSYEKAPTNAQEDDDKPRVYFHMTWLKTIALEESDQLPGLRQMLHNILEWGATDRFQQLKAERLRLYEWQRQQDAATAALKTGHFASLQSKKRRVGDKEASDMR